MKTPEPSTPFNNDFRLFLQNELVKRCSRSKGYSLRAFARQLQISPSALSRILNGKRLMSSSMKLHLGTRLGLDPETLSQFTIGDRVLKTLYFNQVTFDSFNVISEWYHFAILELTYLKGFKSNSVWIAKKLGISVSEANAAVERLFRLKMLGTNAQGKWFNQSGNNSFITDDMRDSAYRNLQKKILEQALNAMDEISIEKRNQSAMTFAIHTKRLPQAISEIKKFRRKMSKILCGV